MPGTITLKPLLANFDNNLRHELVDSVNPYCVVIIGDKKVKGPACRHGGKYPAWKSTFHIPTNNEPYCFVEIKNKQIATHQDIGVSEINLTETIAQGKLTKWYDVYFKKKLAGQILIETSFEEKEISEIYVQEADSEQEEKFNKLKSLKNYIGSQFNDIYKEGLFSGQRKDTTSSMNETPIEGGNILSEIKVKDEEKGDLEMKYDTNSILNQTNNTEYVVFQPDISVEEESKEIIRNPLSDLRVLNQLNTQNDILNRLETIQEISKENLGESVPDIRVRFLAEETLIDKKLTDTNQTVM